MANLIEQFKAYLIKDARQNIKEIQKLIKIIQIIRERHHEENIQKLCNGIIRDYSDILRDNYEFIKEEQKSTRIQRRR